MTMMDKLEAKIADLKEKCEAQRKHIEKNFNGTYKEVIDLSHNRTDYLICDISLLKFSEDSIDFIIEFEDGQTQSLHIKPGEIRMNF